MRYAKVASYWGGTSKFGSAEWVESKEWYEIAYGLMRNCYRNSSVGASNSTALLDSTWELFKHVGPYFKDRKVMYGILDNLYEMRQMKGEIERMMSSKATVVANRKLVALYNRLQEIMWEINVECQQSNMFLRINRSDPRKAAREF